MTVRPSSYSDAAEIVDTKALNKRVAFLLPKTVVRGD